MEGEPAPEEAWEGWDAEGKAAEGRDAEGKAAEGQAAGSADAGALRWIELLRTGVSGEEWKRMEREGTHCLISAEGGA